ncbi:hypothetical protein cypCar_00048278 [Cyprinus carpio]|nr:hypothetical protein cypCar_00048278 [Cyprinus carpio]
MESVGKRRGKRKANDIDLSVQQSPQDIPKKSRVEKAEKVLSPLWDHPQISAAEKAKETGAPTLQTALQEAKQTIEVQKREIATLKEWVDTLKEERNFLRERLTEALAFRSNIPPIKQAPEQRKQESDISDSSSSDSSSEHDSESSETKNRKKKKKSQSKTAKKRGKTLRVKTPDDSIRRYTMVLEKVKKDRISKAEAYFRLGVDRNTIVSQAPIAELAATNPDLFHTLRSTFKRKDSLKRFVETCRGFCEQEPTASAILKKKYDGSLLDIYKN